MALFAIPFLPQEVSIACHHPSFLLLVVGTDQQRNANPKFSWTGVYLELSAQLLWVVALRNAYLIMPSIGVICGVVVANFKWNQHLRLTQRSLLFGGAIAF